MEILVLSIIAGLITIAGLWIASRDTKPTDNHTDSQNPKV
ncbi:hypothetical protein AcdelDRAFT_0019 [Acidovorax delafieldii 2AN]|jgi:hypothetical protein|uniref:Uncharacterized protein n=1 Tax=Acidovorax delafieldii 2AN TaxID=573060 RepID=C5SZD9_ACIDE|nr:hypothetical protein AcdelDRAFT_0019 [Acidovorax delafieldii 2AN]